MDVREVLDHARDAMTVRRVFGDPYEKEGPRSGTVRSRGSPRRALGLG
jgi:hypothetical protein